MSAGEKVGQAKHLRFFQVQRLLTVARNAGISRSLALEYITDYAKKRGWTVSSGSEDERDKPASKAEGTSQPKKTTRLPPVPTIIIGVTIVIAVMNYWVDIPNWINGMVMLGVILVLVPESWFG